MGRAFHIHHSLPHPPLLLWHRQDTPRLLYVCAHPHPLVLPGALFTEIKVVFLKQNVSYPTANMQVKKVCKGND